MGSVEGWLAGQAHQVRDRNARQVTWPMAPAETAHYHNMHAPNACVLPVVDVRADIAKHLLCLGTPAASGWHQGAVKWSRPQARTQDLLVRSLEGRLRLA